MQDIHKQYLRFQFNATHRCSNRCSFFFCTFANGHFSFKLFPVDNNGERPNTLLLIKEMLPSCGLYGVTNLL